MLGSIMPFGNPSFTSQNKSGSDICLSLPEGGAGGGASGRDGQKGSSPSSSGGVDGLYAGGGGSGGGGSGSGGGGGATLGSELNWLDLDNTGLAGAFGGGYGSLGGTHSNPGSLPHEQFQSAFLEDGMGAQLGVMGGFGGKDSNPTMNGFGLGGGPMGGGAGGSGSGVGGGMASFLEPGRLHQSGMYGTDDERLLELGLSS